MRLVVVAFSLLLVTHLVQTASAQGPNAPSTRGIQIVPKPGSSDHLDLQLWTNSRTLKVGDPLQVSVKPTLGSRIYLFFTDSAGVTRRIFPNAYDQENRVRARRTEVFPRNNSYQFRVTGPVGPGTITAYALRDLRGPADNPDDEYLVDGFARSASPRRAMNRLIQGLLRYRDYTVETTRIRITDGRPGPPSQPKYGSLTITSSPSGAAVYIDGSYVGTTTYRTRTLPRGKHNVYLYLPGYQQVYREADITPGENTRLSFRMQPVAAYPYGYNYGSYW